MSLKSFTDYLLLEKNYSVHTISSYKKDLESFEGFILSEYDDSSIYNVNYQQIRNWIVDLVNSGISNRTINRKISALNSYYKFLLKIKVITTNPLAKHKHVFISKRSTLNPEAHAAGFTCPGSRFPNFTPKP